MTANFATTDGVHCKHTYTCKSVIKKDKVTLFIQVNKIKIIQFYMKKKKDFSNYHKPSNMDEMLFLQYFSP